jgi:hypothetical protein
MSNPVSKRVESGPQPREPVFGSGAGSFVAQMTTLLAALCLVFLVLVAGVFVKREAHDFLWGEPQPKAVAPGNYQWTPDKGLQKIN